MKVTSLQEKEKKEKGEMKKKGKGRGVEIRDEKKAGKDRIWKVWEKKGSVL